MRYRFPKIVCDGMTETASFWDSLLPIILLIVTFGGGFVILRILANWKNFKQRNRWFNVIGKNKKKID